MEAASRWPQASATRRLATTSSALPAATRQRWMRSRPSRRRPSLRLRGTEAAARLSRILEAKAALEKEAAEARAEELREQARVQREKASDQSVDAAERKRAATRAEKADEKARELTGRTPTTTVQGPAVHPATCRIIASPSSPTASPSRARSGTSRTPTAASW